MNILEYFDLVFPHPKDQSFPRKARHPHGKDTYEDTLASMPLDSNCGLGCKNAIDNARAFAKDIERAFGREDFGVYASHLGNLMRVLSCYICG